MKLSEIAQSAAQSAAQKLQEALEKSAEPVELSQLANNNSKYFEKYKDALWGKDRLMYRGMKFFDAGGELGEAYEKAIDAAKKEIGNAQIPVEITLDQELLSKICEDGNCSDWDFFELDVKADPGQECYLGYSKEDDCLYIGFDGHVDEDDMNEEWDRQFKKETGVDFDYSNPLHEKLFSKVHKAWQKLSFQGLLLKLTPRGKGFIADLVDTAADGFYRGIFRSKTFKELKLLDLRLD